jgi:molybdopterin converting factor small subunit
MDADGRQSGAPGSADRNLPTVTVSLPATLTAPEPPSAITCEAATAGDALRAVAAHMPRLAERLLHDRRPLVHIVLNGVALVPSDAETLRLSSGDRLELVPPIAGG